MPGVVLGNRLLLLTSFTGALLGAVLFAPAGRANFLDDLFGPEDYVAPSRANPGARQSRPSARRQIGRIRSHIGYFPSYRHESRRKSQIAYIQRDDLRRNDADGDEPATGSRPVRPAFCARGAEALPDASRFRQLLNDKTLRFGDIVVTREGLRVFTGHATCPHFSKDFVALGAAGLSRRRLGALAKLENAIKATHSRYAHR